MMLLPSEYMLALLPVLQIKKKSHQTLDISLGAFRIKSVVVSCHRPAKRQPTHPQETAANLLPPSVV